MSCTELSIAGSVTSCKQYLQPDILLSHSPNEEDVVIAPWLGDEPVRRTAVLSLTVDFNGLPPIIYFNFLKFS
jgi:hypothetical protein